MVFSANILHLSFLSLIARPNLKYAQRIMFFFQEKPFVVDLNINITFSPVHNFSDLSHLSIVYSGFSGARSHVRLISEIIFYFIYFFIFSKTKVT